MTYFDTLSLKKWFLENKRDLPWRENSTPYAVWISEVMLQQTQASVVVPYFLRWMTRFPTIQALAIAELDEVIKEWEGLGYYSRARFLHEGARYVLAAFNGQIPHEVSELKKIKGLGDYTVGAIRSFAFHQKAAAVDGNVLRVAARYFRIGEDISKPKTVKMIRELIESILPEAEPWIVSEGLIELGATVCGKKPRCGECPLKNTCQAYSAGVADRLPFKSSKIKTEFLYRAVAVISAEDCWLLKRGEKGKIMSDLHEFPYFETEQNGWSEKQLLKHIQNAFEIEANFKKSMEEVKHSFTRYQVTLRPCLFEVSTRKDIPGYLWVERSDLRKLAFSSGHKRILYQMS